MAYFPVKVQIWNTTAKGNPERPNRVIRDVMQGVYRFSTELKINAQDDGMKRYRQQMHEQCKLELVDQRRMQRAV
jgi:hypothetical protein